jgi:hypothetical protein
MATQLISKKVSYKGINSTMIFFQPLFKDVVGLNAFKLMSNVRNKQKMGFVNKLEGIVQKKTGCGFTPSGKLGVYERTISVNPAKINLEICNDEFKNTLWEEKTKSGNLQYDLSGTEIMDILLQQAREGAAADILKLFWFGDTSSNDILLNVADGIWQVHIPALVAQNLIPYVDTNAGTPLASGDATDYLQEVYDNAPLALKGLPNSMKASMVSGSIYDAYIKDLQTANLAVGVALTLDGMQNVRFNGIPVIPNYLWDGYDANDLGAPNTHRILYTTPENLVFATDLTSDLNSFIVFTDELEEKTYVKANFDLGTNYVHESLFSVGY